MSVMVSVTQKQTCGRWVGSHDWGTRDIDPRHAPYGGDLGYHPVLIGEAITDVETLDTEDSDLGLHTEDRFVLRVPTGYTSQAHVDFLIAGCRDKSGAAPAWVHHLRPGRIVEVMFGSLAALDFADRGTLRQPDHRQVHLPWAVRVFVPDE